MAQTGSLFLQLTNTPAYFEGRDADQSRVNPYPTTSTNAQAWSLGRAHRREARAAVADRLLAPLRRGTDDTLNDALAEDALKLQAFGQDPGPTLAALDWPVLGPEAK